MDRSRLLVLFLLLTASTSLLSPQARPRARAAGPAQADSTAKSWSATGSWREPVARCGESRHWNKERRR